MRKKNALKTKTCNSFIDNVHAIFSLIRLGLSLTCPRVVLRNANHTVTLSSAAQEPLNTRHQYLVYCWNITGVEWMQLEVVCKFRQSWPQSINFYVIDGAPGDQMGHFPSEYFPNKIVSSRPHLMMYFELATHLQSFSCEVQPDQDNSGRWDLLW